MAGAAIGRPYRVTPASSGFSSRTTRLPYNPPYAWAVALAFLARRAIAGVEQVEGEVYRRTSGLDGLPATVAISHDEANSALVVRVQASVHVPSLDALDPVTARARPMFDLDADTRTIGEHLQRDHLLAPLVAARPGLRVFGGWDGFEIAVRAIIGQQVSVARARQLLGVLVQRCGDALPDGANGALNRMFPAPGQVLAADLSAIGMPGARVAALKAVAEAALADRHLFESAGSIEKTVERLRAIRGVGEWTAHYIAMRACREMDAFPASDVGLLRGAAGVMGRRPSPAELASHAEAWRPWRAYAAQQLWAADPA